MWKSWEGALKLNLSFGIKLLFAQGSILMGLRDPFPILDKSTFSPANLPYISIYVFEYISLYLQSTYRSSRCTQIFAWSKSYMTPGRN